MSFLLFKRTKLYNSKNHTNFIRLYKNNQQRSMYKARAFITNVIAKPMTINRQSRQNYCSKYKAVRVKKTLTEDEKRRLNLTQHESTHYNIKNNETGFIEALFTSAKKNKDNYSPVNFEKVDSVKVNGSFIPLIDPVTKKPILDANGNMIPDPNKGGQYMATYTRSREIAKDAKHLYEEDKNVQAYLDKNKQVIEDNIKKSKASMSTSLPKKIGGQDDEPL